MDLNYEKKSGKMNLQAKQEDDANQLLPKAKISSSRQWSAFRNPRIVRVPPTFGGKDRHSKVCTIRGLRDRRIRLSVPTAIQLYDLQDKLELGQPSKVIDWLLDVTKNDIDDLPPLQIPLGFDQLIHHQQQQPQYGSFNHPQYQFNPNFNSLERFKLADSKDIVMGESSLRGKEKEVYNYNQGGNFNPSSYNFLNNGLPFYNWDPSSLSLASTPQLPSSSSFGSHQFFFSPPPPPQAQSTNMASALFPMSANSHQYESRTISNNFQLLSSGNISSSHHQFLVGSSTNINKPFSLNENPGLDDHPQKMMIDREKDIG